MVWVSPASLSTSENTELQPVQVKDPFSPQHLCWKSHISQFQECSFCERISQWLKGETNALLKTKQAWFIPPEESGYPVICDEGMKRRTNFIHLNWLPEETGLLWTVHGQHPSLSEWEEKAGAAVRLRGTDTARGAQEMQPVLSHSCSTQTAANCSRGESTNSWSASPWGANPNCPA